MGAFDRPVRRPSRNEGGEWLSVSDLMAGLMVIFLFIAIVYIRPLVETQSKIREVTETWVDVRQDIYEALRTEFAADLERWDAELVRDTLTIRFRAPDILFDPGDDEVKGRFARILTSFFPRYLDVLSRFRADIEEVRIEGHTSREWADASEREAYFLNMELSQDRTRSVLAYGFEAADSYRLQPWARSLVTANGLSSSKPITRSDGSEDAERSRRVEFRVRTNAAARIDEIVRNLQ